MSGLLVKLIPTPTIRYLELFLNTISWRMPHTFWLFIKISFGSLIYIFAFTSAISFGDFTVISFFKNESYETLPILLYKLIGSYRFEEASFVAGFILVFSLFLYLTFDARNQKDKPAKTTWR